ncbi:unnamed protein product [Polarella glacialis]|uniref:Calcium-dependent protein kinase 1 n=2 Tax=Polarella glacialis TaxID=89957 RepID=A0A813GE16_POLGL|nr:unnamed protein product [Polarella glacialis]|mmetsp:Transcript_98760/g.178310  ORF Transcript_98760/g.178310 Transcript_98760/m.178310 type:complete len:490 (+) Transcript_98760:52-1521(+)
MGCKGSKAAEGGNTAKDTKAKDGTVGHGFMIVTHVEGGKKLQDCYTVDKKKLGEGSYGTVSMCSHKDTKVDRAVKSIAKKDIKQKERFQQEIDLMKLLDHPNIIKLYETFEDRKNIYLVMELCTGGELFDRIIELQSFTEVQAAIVMKQILGGISYMHASKICHRDLKPENFLFTNKDPIEKSTLKIIDFGLASKFKEGGVLSTKAGTPYYVAPQVLAGAYNQSADLWSCGVIMFVLLVGYPPFHGETDNEVLAKVKSGRFHFEAADWKNVSEDAKYLIRQLLKMNPPERYTAEQALNHTWVVEKAPRALNAPLSAGLVANLQGFRSKNKLKKAALHVIASQMSDAQIKSLRDIFMSLDSDGDGLLTAKELTDGMNKAGFTEIPADFAAILKDVDSNGSGVIDYTEFLAATLDKKAYIQEDVVWAAFRVFDRDGNGKISKQELEQVLNDGEVAALAVRDIAELLQEVDKNGDGEIDFDEFFTMMRNERQ